MPYVHSWVSFQRARWHISLGSFLMVPLEIFYMYIFLDVSRRHLFLLLFIGDLAAAGRNPTMIQLEQYFQVKETTENVSF